MNFHYMPMVDNDMPGAWPVGTPGARLAGFIKRTTIHCYIKNMKGLGLVVWEKKICSCFSHDAPGAGPVWIPGARLAGFIKRTTIHCFTQNMKALGLVVWEKKIFLCFSHCKSIYLERIWAYGLYIHPFKRSVYNLLDISTFFRVILEILTKSAK